MFNPDTGNKLSIEKLVKGPDAMTRNRSFANKFGRLAKGVGLLQRTTEQVYGTNPLLFIPHFKVPNNVRVTYANFICDICPLKPEKCRVHLTVNGDKLDYEEDTSSPTIYLLDTNILLNSIISDADKEARCCTVEIKQFYLNNPMKTYRYMTNTHLPLHK